MKKVALHIIMPKQTSGPNTANRLMARSYLSEHYDFCFITQNYHAGGKINLKLINDLRKQIKDEKPDLIHLSGLQASGFHAVVAARLAGCKNILVTIRGYSGDALDISKPKKFIFDNIIEPLTLRLCKAFYTVCEEAGNKKMVINNKKKYLGVIHNAAPKINIDITNQRKITRNKYNFKDEDYVIAISGRMTYDKGIEYISQAITMLDEQGYLGKIKFMFIGDGEYCDILKERHAKNIKNQSVFVLGQVNNVIELLCGCDTFLFATLHENLSNALLEAMSVGLPIIATQIGGNVEVVEDMGNGFLVQEKNSQIIVEKVCELYNNKVEREVFAKRSQEIIKEKFTQENLYSKISEIYENMLG